MKKLLLVVAASLSLIACTKNAEQVNAAKKQMAEWNISEEDAAGYEFKTDEVLDKDLYNILYKNYTKEYNKYADSDPEMAGLQLKESGKYVSLLEKAENKTFYIVKANKIVAGDTLHKKIFYIDDINNIIDIDNIR